MVGGSGVQSLPEITRTETAVEQSASLDGASWVSADAPLHHNLARSVGAKRDAHSPQEFGARLGTTAFLRSRQEGRVPVVFVTAHCEDGSLERIHKAVPGAPVLSKPVYRDTLADAVSRSTPVIDGMRSKAVGFGPLSGAFGKKDQCLLCANGHSAKARLVPGSKALLSA